MRVFVSGATGYIGSGLLRGLLRAGHRPVGLARSREKAEALGLEGIEWVIGNLRELESYRAAAAGCDAIVHAAAEHGPEVAAVHRLAIDTFVKTARAAGSHRTFIYTSGVWVLGAARGRPADENAPIDHPPEAAAWRPGHERDVLEAGAGTLTTAVIRPGYAYGARRGFFGAMIAEAVRDGAPTVVGDGKNRWASVHLDDLSDLYVRVLELAWTIGFQQIPPHERLFHAVDGTATPVEEIASALAKAAGRDGTVRHLPLAEARERRGPSADAMALDQVAATTRSERALGWRPRYRGVAPNAAELFAEWSRGR